MEEKDKYTYTGKEVGEIERKYDEKIDTLEQQLKSQPAEIVEKIKEQLYSKARSITGTSVNCVRLYDIRQILDTILKEYQK